MVARRDGADEGFLYRVAWRRVRAHARSMRARAARERRWVEETLSGGVVEGANRDRVAQLHALIDTIEAVLPDPALRAIFPLWLAQERSTEAYAMALNLNGGEASEVRQAVKRCKDRLTKFLQRHPRVREAAQRLREE